MKTTFALLVAFLSFGLHAQVTFSTKGGSNGMTYAQCEQNQKNIYRAYLKKTDSQLQRLSVGIQEEMDHSRTTVRLKKYRLLMHELLYKRIFTEELISQIDKFNWENFSNDDEKVRERDLFKLTNIKIDLKERLVEALEESANPGQEITTYVIDQLKGEAQGQLQDTVKSRVGRASLFEFLGTSATASSMGKLSITLGRSLVTGAAKGAVIGFVTQVIQSYRGLPENEWLDVLEEYPELVLNPDWRKLLGTQDHPWSTHCITIHREPKKMQKVVSNFLANEEYEFLKTVDEISKVKAREEVTVTDLKEALKDYDPNKPKLKIPSLPSFTAPDWAKAKK